VLGGSISSPSQNNSAWPDALVTWLLEKYPHVRFSVENAAAGSTGSQYALFRAQEDIIERDCDLIFIEYAVNDSIVSPEIRMRTREGLIRKIRSATKADIVIVYTFMQNMYDDMLNEQMPPSIKEFEQLAEHYGISSVWMGLHALEEVKQGRMTWAQWLPDGLHPQERGSLSYA
jgi:lysophospholipase L1-like esterase